MDIIPRAEERPAEDGNLNAITLAGKSLMDFCDMEINPAHNLLGNRWLERTNVAFIVAPSGQGKSTLSINAAMEWSCGRTSFDIRPVRALRILVVQAEDNMNDCM